MQALAPRPIKAFGLEHLDSAGPSRVSLQIFHVVYGLRVASNLALPGLAVCKERGPANLQIRLQERMKFAAKFGASLSHVFYTSPNPDGESESLLQVGTLDDGRYIGFFYGDGARFAVEREGREIWGVRLQNRTLEDSRGNWAGSNR